ncbi:NmrA family transcriptional regulator [Planotetraspora thailandica]|uniref:NmrA family transcriptional regulator n=1 Tax=Planotetraspora thailandica TaxID=487172 RepID=A0A8J3V3A7_9ACTN|nr:NAD(P)H-binding protein [Planotetraspora thailandica]GII54762.1 NmrA family transcriptional regulator [Planotetraspora thailandica]
MTENAGESAVTLVVGGAGKTGRRVVRRLREKGIAVRPVSRSSTPRFDWNEPGTWADALKDADSAYVTYHPDLAMPGAADVVGAFAKQAVASGTRRLVLLSGRGEEGAQAAERAVRESGAEWTILRSAWFFQNFNESFLLEQVLEGVIAMPAGSVAEPFVDAEDVADAAVAALTSSRHVGEVYELTGPRLMTFADAAAEIGEATGRDIRYVAVSPEEYEAALAGQMPAEEARLLTALFSEVLDGHNAHLSDGVRRALGREPADFADFAPDAAATGVWEAS